MPDRRRQEKRPAQAIVLLIAQIRTSNNVAESFTIAVKFILIELALQEFRNDLSFRDPPNNPDRLRSRGSLRILPIRERVQEEWYCDHNE